MVNTSKIITNQLLVNISNIQNLKVNEKFLPQVLLYNMNKNFKGMKIKRKNT